MSNAEGERSPGVIGTAMAVLRCFTSQDHELGVVEIAERVGMHKSSVSRLMGTLEAEDLVARDPSSRKYRLGLGLLSVAGTLLADLDVRRAAHPILVDLAALTEESCSLMLWADDESVCVEQVPSSQAIKHTTAIGTSYRTTASSSVLIFLAHLEAAEVARVVDEGGIRLQGHRSLGELTAELEEVRATGCALNEGASDPGEVGVSAIVHDHRGEPVAAVLISAPRFRVDEQRAAELARMCVEAADRITTSLGGTPTHR